jgi:hypothetical protein
MIVPRPALAFSACGVIQVSAWHVAGCVQEDAMPEPKTAAFSFTREAETPVLTARVPSTISAEEFGHVARNAYELISKLTGHPCMSGRIKFAVDDMFLNPLTKVDLQTGKIV